MFENPEIALDDLPAAQDLSWQAMHPRYARRMQVERLFVVLIALTATIVLGFIAGPAFDPSVPLWALVIVFAIPYLGWPLISVPRRGYALRERDIVFRSGVLWRSVTAVPFNRVQHVETSNTPLDRKFGLANLQIFTAGGSGGDLSISGLGVDRAEQLRVFILEKVGASIENH